MLKFTPASGEIWASTSSTLKFGWKIARRDASGPDSGPCHSWNRDRAGREHCVAGNMSLDGGMGIADRCEPASVEPHDMEFHGKEGERVIPWDKNTDRYAGIFDDLLVHDDPPGEPAP